MLSDYSEGQLISHPNPEVDKAIEGLLNAVPAVMKRRADAIAFQTGWIKDPEGEFWLPCPTCNQPKYRSVNHVCVVSNNGKSFWGNAGTV